MSSRVVDLMDQIENLLWLRTVEELWWTMMRMKSVYPYRESALNEIRLSVIHARSVLGI